MKSVHLRFVILCHSIIILKNKIIRLKCAQFLHYKVVTMNIVSLHTCIAIVETGSLVRASEKMNVIQSKVTARLKILEQDLGQVLLNQHKSGTTLTPAGSKLLRYARVMTGLWRQAQNEAGLPDGMDSLFSFGCHSDLWSGLGKRIFDGILSRQPNMVASVYQGGVQELQDWMVSGWVDVVLSYTPLARIGQQAHRIALYQRVLYSNRHDSPIAYDPGYVFVDYGEEYRRAHGEAYYDAGKAKISFDSPGAPMSTCLSVAGLRICQVTW